MGTDPRKKQLDFLNSIEDDYAYWTDHETFDSRQTWFNKQWGMFASIAAVKTKSDLVAAGSTVIQTTIDFRPIVYSAGLNYRF